MTAQVPVVTSRRRKLAPVHLADLDRDERRSVAVELGLPAYRADQVAGHYFRRLSPDPDTWTDIPASQRDMLAEALTPQLLDPVRHLSCDRGETVKYLWRLHDGPLVEGVVMRYPNRATMCISSQAGCGMNCPFCATGQGGLTRNLSTGEIVAQAVIGAAAMARGEIGGRPGRLSNVVFMGMGEPLANYDAVLAAVRRLLAPPPEGLGLSARGITVSTVGLVPRMKALAGEGIPVTLALSLHAPDDELRRELVPVNKRWSIDEVLEAAWENADATGRRVSIEYALIRNVNDQPWRADMLAERLRGHLAHVNLIPLNPTPGSKWTASDPAVADEFLRRVQAGGVAATVRDTRGREIDGACGQLAAAE